MSNSPHIHHYASHTVAAPTDTTTTTNPFYSGTRTPGAEARRNAKKSVQFLRKLVAKLRQKGDFVQAASKAEELRELEEWIQGEAHQVEAAKAEARCEAKRRAVETRAEAKRQEDERLAELRRQWVGGERLRWEEQMRAKDDAMRRLVREVRELGKEEWRWEEQMYLAEEKRQLLDGMVLCGEGCKRDLLHAEEEIAQLEKEKRVMDERLLQLEGENKILARRLRNVLRSITRWYPHLNSDQVEAFLASIEYETVDKEALTVQNADMITHGKTNGYYHKEVRDWIDKGLLRVIDEKMNIQLRLKGPTDDDPALVVYNSNGVPKAPFPLIPIEDQFFLRNAYHLITHMRRDLAGLRKTGLKGGTMYAYGLRAGFVKGVRYGRYAFAKKYLNTEEVWKDVIAIERELALVLANIGRSYFPWTWEANIELQMNLDTNGLGDAVPGSGGNPTITDKYWNTLHTDKDGNHAWGWWAYMDLLEPEGVERTPEQLALMLDGVPYLVFPELVVAVKLYHGVILNWDSPNIKHATSQTLFKPGYSRDEFAIFGSSMQWAKALLQRADPNREPRDEMMERLWVAAHRKAKAEHRGRGKGKGKGKVVDDEPVIETFLDEELAKDIAANEGSPWKDSVDSMDTRSSKRKAMEQELQPQPPPPQPRTKPKKARSSHVESKTQVEPQSQPQPQLQPQPHPQPQLQPEPQSLAQLLVSQPPLRSAARKAMANLKKK
ncbi:hypothetical protein HK097_007508 [Rhizophlyctis rosea]|uniref:Uncharacterized protein n=1 Tax=Rhizophlyctis rosea TaxID=64517 RepID=A0AAD5SDG1_9FUNG|nr:hypothetical protein HK097_007508 [Rhizophlyctis rosea]